MNMDEAVAVLSNLAEEDYYSENGGGYKRQADFKVYPAGGSKYLKLVVESYGQKSVFGFIVADAEGTNFKYGDLLKAASWKAPAKNFARGNIFDPASYSDLRWTGIA